MSRSANDRLRSAAEAARLIADRSSGRTIDDYASDPDLRAKLERWLEKIGEALSQARRLLPELHLAIPDQELSEMELEQRYRNMAGSG